MLALSIALKPQEMASATYQLRMGNVDGANDADEHEDGGQYPGRGVLQPTGGDN